MGWLIGGVDHILDADGHAVQWTTKGAGRLLPVGFMCLRQRPLCIEKGPGMNIAVQRFDPVETGARQRIGAEFAGPDFLRGRDGGKLEQVGHGDPDGRKRRR